MNCDYFRGAWTALITPFKRDETIDWTAVEKLIEFQIKGGVTGILVIGTTGESPTLTDGESEELIRRAKALIRNRCLLMAGCGTNSTAKSIHKAKAAKEAGADVLLVVNPYYNKPTQKGLYLHFKAVAEATNLPVILYNIKGRTGVNLEIDTLMKLVHDVPNIVAVKEASGDLAQIADVCKRRPKGFLVFSGDDGLTAEILEKDGADGVISVASNLVPREVVQMVDEGLKKDFPAMNKLNEKLQPLFKDLFIETNPIPVKYAAYKMGFCNLVYRLPMCSPSEKNESLLNDRLQSYKLI